MLILYYYFIYYKYRNWTYLLQKSDIKLIICRNLNFKIEYNNSFNYILCNIL